MRTLATLALAMLAACDGLAPDGLTDLDDQEDEPPTAAADLQTASVPRTITTDGCTNTFDFERELVIRDLAVVEDPARTTGAGAWTFGHLVAELAGARDPSALARDFLQTWETSPTLEGQRVRGNRGKVDDLLLDPWRADGFALAKAPFRLLAIALRPDTPGGPELRFVFGAVSPAPARAALPMTVAFEYRVTPAFLVRWHETLAPLAPLGPGAAAYRDALARLTEDGINAAGGTNGSALAQVRTNEVAIDTPWDLREFHLAAPGALVPARLAKQPRIDFDGDARLATGVTPSMETYQAVMPSADFTWHVAGATEAARFAFAMSTCAGCHAGETGTQFVHIQPRAAGAVADLSAFLLSRTCAPHDDACRALEQRGAFTDPAHPAHHFTTQDDRLAALNAVLATAHSCR